MSTLKPRNTWFDNSVGVAKNQVKKIVIISNGQLPSTGNLSWIASSGDSGITASFNAGTLTLSSNSKIIANADSSLLFADNMGAGFTALTTIEGLNNIDTSNVTNLTRAFQGAFALTAVDFAWNLSKVTSLDWLFQGDKSLSSVTMRAVSGTPLLTGAAGLINMGKPNFTNKFLQHLDLSSFDFNKVTSIYGFVNYCAGLKTITFKPDCYFTNCENFQYAFAGTQSLEALDCSKWNPKHPTNLSFFLSQSTYETANNVLQRIDLSGMVNAGSITTLQGAFSLNKKVTEIILPKVKFSECTTLEDTFSYLESIKRIVNAEGLVCDKITSLKSAFSGLNSLEELDVSEWDVSSVKDFNHCFTKNPGSYPNYNPTKLSGLDVSNWDTSSAEDMSFMFYGQYHLPGGLDVSHWDVSKVKSLDHFMAFTFLDGIDTSHWVTSSLINAGAIFYSCQNEYIDISNFVWDNVDNLDQAFEVCRKVKKIYGIEQITAPKCRSFRQMFLGCGALTEIDISSLDTRSAHAVLPSGADPNNPLDNKISNNGAYPGGCKEMFDGATNVKFIKIGPNFKYDGDGTLGILETDCLEGYTPDGLPFYARFPGWTGKPGGKNEWYLLNGDAVNIEEALKQSNPANTYYQSLDKVKNEIVLIKNGTLIDIASAIKEKAGNSVKLLTSEMAQAIRQL